MFLKLHTAAGYVRRRCFCYNLSMEYPERVTYFASTDSRGQVKPFGIKNKDRSKHMYVIGKTGMGKSTLLENMAIQDIQNGEGLAFVDPHGASADELLNYIPEERIKDVIYFAPFDLENPIAFNVMEDVGYDKRHLVVSGLMSTFKKVWKDAWSSRMEYILSSTIFALLEYPDSTLLGINRMYTDKEYRNKVVENIKDPTVSDFWTKEFATYTDNYAKEATPAIQNKIGQFTNNPLIRNIVGQPKSSFDLREVMDKKKILIVNLSKGLVGESNQRLLGSMITTRIYLAAMSRADLSRAELAHLPAFNFYVDEFQNFADETFAEVLSEARKYKLNLTVAHQYVDQMEEEVREAIFGNVGTFVTFRVGPIDAEVLEKVFVPRFTAEDLVNLDKFQIYLSLMIDGVGSAPFSARTIPPIEKPPINYREDAIKFSQETYGNKRETIEQLVRDDLNSTRTHKEISSAASQGPPKGKPQFNKNQNNKNFSPKRFENGPKQAYKKQTENKQPDLSDLRATIKQMVDKDQKNKPKKDTSALKDALQKSGANKNTPQNKAQNQKQKKSKKQNKKPNTKNNTPKEQNQIPEKASDTEIEVSRKKLEEILNGKS